MKNNSEYEQPMQPSHSLKHMSKQVKLTKDDLTIFYFEDGEQNPQTMILIHGLGDEADTWRHVIGDLAKDYHVIALDLPGFGRSSQPDRDYTPDFFMTTIISLMDELSIDKSILMGSSLGGIFSHGLAIDYPARVSGVILVGGALLQSSALHDFSLQLMRIPMLGEWLYTRLRKDPQAAFDSLQNVYNDLDTLPEEDQEFLFERVNKRVWSDEQRRAYFSTLRKLIPWVKAKQKNLEDKLEKLTLPTLVIRGEHDQLFSEENAKEIIERQTNSIKVSIDNAGHLPHQENPKAFLRITKNWLHQYFNH
jgi:pimeloyl-ACP methyl ester carboxylesterase